tara:strand:+ start:86 stop:280 length:195 start_codon:yes stop_codon:yes gene_type:complete
MKAKKEKITFSIEKDLRDRLEELYRVQVIRNVDKGEKLSSFSKVLEKVLTWGLESKGTALYESL